MLTSLDKSQKIMQKKKKLKRTSDHKTINLLSYSIGVASTENRYNVDKVPLWSIEYQYNVDRMSLWCR